MLKLNTTKVYADLLRVKISLEFQPVPDPSYIQGKMIDCSVCQDNLEKIFIDATQELSDKDCLFRTEQYNIECKKRDLLTNNKDVKNRPSLKEREAAAEDLLDAEKRNMITLENEINTLKDVLGAIKLIQGNVNRKSADLKMMVRLMEQQVGRLGIGMKGDPGMSEMAKNLAELNKLATEMTVDDVESSSEYVDTEETDGKSEAKTTQQSTATDSQDSEEETNSGIEIGDVLAGGSGVEAINQPTALDATKDTKPEGESSGDDVLDSFLTDISDDQTNAVSYEDTEEVSSDESKSGVEEEKAPEASSTKKNEPVTIRGEVDLDLSELGISLDDEDSSKKKADEEWVFPDKPASKPKDAPVAKITNKKEDKPPVQSKKVTEPIVTKKPETKKPDTNESDIDLDSLLDNLR